MRAGGGGPQKLFKGCGEKMSGRILSLEGLDGSGKTTQADALCRVLTERGLPYRRIKFPDYSDPSSTLVKMYLAGELGGQADAVNAYAASSFYAVDRFASFVRYWQSDYLQGTHMVTDRYVTSNFIYQMPKLPRAEWESYICWLQDYEYEKLGLPRPDRVLFFDMPIEVSQELLTKRYEGPEEKKDLHEKDREYLKKCRECALYTAERLGWAVINCVENDHPKTIASIHGEVLERTSGLF